MKELFSSGFVSKINQARFLSPHVSFLTRLAVHFLAELYEIFLSRAKERWRSFRETGSEVEAEGTSLQTPRVDGNVRILLLPCFRSSQFLNMNFLSDTRPS